MPLPAPERRTPLTRPTRCRATPPPPTRAGRVHAPPPPRRTDPQQSCARRVHTAAAAVNTPRLLPLPSTAKTR